MNVQTCLNFLQIIYWRVQPATAGYMITGCAEKHVEVQGEKKQMQEEAFVHKLHGFVYIVQQG